MRIEFAQKNSSILPSLKESAGPEKSDKSFAKTLSEAIGQVDSMQKEADSLAIKIATGDTDDVHQAMISMEKAVLALEFAVQVRNKAIEAYQELMRTQV